MTEASTIDPVNVTRCQCEESFGSFMTLGPRNPRQCTNKPTWLVVENKKQKGEKFKGMMSLCNHHKEIFENKLGKDHGTFYRIKR